MESSLAPSTCCLYLFSSPRIFLAPLFRDPQLLSSVYGVKIDLSRLGHQVQVVKEEVVVFGIARGGTFKLTRVLEAESQMESRVFDQTCKYANRSTQQDSVASSYVLNSSLAIPYL